MITKFLSLEWKQFSRSAYFQKGLFVKILMLLFVLYMALVALFMGAGSFFMVEELTDKDPFAFINSFLIYWVLADLSARFFLQQMPVMNIQPLMIIPIQKNKVINFLIAKTVFSFWNLLPLLYFIPFSGVLIYKGYGVVSVLSWMLAMISIALCVNFINFIINKNNTFFYSLIGVIAVLGSLHYFQIINVEIWSQQLFTAFYHQIFWLPVVLLLVYLGYKYNFNFLKKHFYLDEVVQKKTTKIATQELKFLDRFGKIAPFLKNDVRMIWRNARPKQVLLTSFFFLFYGLIFYTQEMYTDMPAILAFASIFVTGGFLLTFGAYVPSWDSEYYKLMMSQNIPYKDYLASKWLLMTAGVLVSTILSVPYIYFGWEIYSLILAGAVFNLGLNSLITLYGGALNRVPVELNVKAKAFGNTQGFNMTQLIIGLPKMLGPIIIFYIPYKLISHNAGVIALVIAGILGLVLKNVLLKFIEKTYQKGKYKTIAAFSEKK
ncbi:MAG: DUF5687 family protein [Bacteroidota bacterium]